MMQDGSRNDSNVVWASGLVTHAERQNLLGQNPRTLWFTGLSGAGKSTLAFRLERALLDAGKLCFVLDGDNVRHGLNQDLGFSSGDRTENIRRVSEVAKLMNEAGLIVIVSLISPFADDRERAQSIIGRERFREIHISTSIDVCESRDPKGLYSKARTGAISSFTGVSSPYQAPNAPDLILDAGLLTVDECVEKLLKFLEWAAAKTECNT